MKMKEIMLFVLSGALVACASAKPTTLLKTTTPPASSVIPIQTSTPTMAPVPSITPTQTSVPTLTPTAETNPALERVAQIGGTINGITVVGDTAYVGIGPRVAAIDISQNKSPRLVNQSEPLPGLVTHLVHISGEPASKLLVNAGKYLVLVDISNPVEIYPIHQLELAGAIMAMVWDDSANILYSGGSIYQHPSEYTGFISAVDITPENQLKLLNSVNMPETPLSLALGEGSLFAGANGYEGGLYHVQVKNHSELSTPRQVIASTPEVPLVPTGMQVIGDRLYLGYWGVEAYDITNPGQPVKIWVDSVTDLNIATSFSIDGDQVYVTGFSIREPDISEHGTFTAPDPIRGSPMGEVASTTTIHNGDFIVADRNLEIFDTANPQGLQLVGIYKPPVTNAINAVANEKAIFVVDIGVADGLSNAVLSVLSLPDLKPLGQITTEFPNSRWNELRGIALEGDRVYLATKDRIWVYGMSSREPILLGKVEIYAEQLEAVTALKLGEKRLLFTLQSTEDKYNVLWVYDLTDLQKPTTSANPLTLDQGLGAQMTWTGSALYIFLQTSYFSKDDRLYAVDFNKDTLALKGSVALTGNTDNMAADGNLVVLTGTSASMNRSTISVVQPETLKLLSTRTLPENGMGVAIIGEMLMVVVGGSWDFGGEAQLMTFDLRSPIDPRQVYVMDIAFSDNHIVPILYSLPYVILANGAGGVEVLDYGQ